MTAWIALGLAVVVALVGGLALVLAVKPGTAARAEKSVPAAAPGSASAATPGSGSASEPVCPAHATDTQFEPTSARIGVLHRTYEVVQVPRVDGAIGAPPVTERGKHLIGWDHAVKPGARHGTVIIDAHTWPDGSALGNAMLAHLDEGDVVQISDDDETVCYRVTSRQSYPVERVPMAKIAREWGKPRLAIIVCSGKRVGPRDWLRRTVWMAART